MKEYSPERRLEIQAKRRATFLARYGVEHQSQIPKVKRSKAKKAASRTAEQIRRETELSHKTKIAKYGSLQAAANTDKNRRTQIERHGSHEASQRKRMRKQRRTLLREYGVSNPSRMEDHRDKINAALKEHYGSLEKATQVRLKKFRAVSKKRYGVSHPNQDPEVFHRSRKSRFQFFKVRTANSGVLKIQGGLERKLTAKLDSMGLLLEVPYEPIQYRLDGKIRKYFPDLFALNPNTGSSFLVEVKSDFTLNRDLEKNCAKFRAANSWCKRNGIKFVLCVTGSGGYFEIEWPTQSKLQSFNLI